MTLPPDLEQLGQRLHAAAQRSVRRRRALKQVLGSGLAVTAALVAGIMIGSPPDRSVVGAQTGIVSAGPTAVLATRPALADPIEPDVPLRDRRSHPCSRPQASGQPECGPRAFETDVRPY